MATVARLHEALPEFESDADAPVVLEAHVHQIGLLGPTSERFVVATTTAEYLTTVKLTGPGNNERPRAAILAAGDNRLQRLADATAPELRLRAFAEHGAPAEDQRTSTAAEGDGPARRGNSASALPRSMAST
ncbi:hypothetical protein [Streptomyces sp. 769]|uniref:hypothetical protein n=1 Tax=Streptomyces sp. 769 TaxID=1262452 RepID=UPI00058003BF|nr:hypothetical protein [Streptomyces sp. 769]